MIYKASSGVSLIELLIVLLIFTIIAGLGYSAVSSFKMSTEIQSNALQFESVIKTVQNWSRNNVASKANPQEANVSDPFSSTVDSYMIYFNYSANVYSIYSCVYDSYIQTYSCTSEPFNNSLSSLIQLHALAPYPCSGIMFETLSGDMTILDSGTYDMNSISKSNFTSTACNVKFAHSKNSAKYFVQYSFNETNDSYYRL